ncbi:MAG: glutamyl-tRNA reductase [Deltaproteobacteria bacterium]|nr:glutamyl-tRNA reductase [Deltaproteobacteria bacterium]
MNAGEQLLCWGVNHERAPIAARETIAVAAGQHDAWLKGFRDAGLAEIVLLSTCNRTELYAMIDATNDAIVKKTLGTMAPQSGTIFAEYGYRHRETAAFRHLVRVASSLDSLVVGEPQILGQVKSAYDRACAMGTVGRWLHGYFQRAFRIAKQVRTETGVGSQPVSVGSVAVALAGQIFGTLESCTALVLGAGEMGEQVAQYLRSAQIGRLLVTSRTTTRATELAQRYGGRPVPWVAWESALAEADIVICSAAAPHLLIGPGQLDQARGCRQDRPIFLIDIALPRNIDEAVTKLNGVYLYDLDDLKAVADEHLQMRRAAVDEAIALVETAVDQHWRALTNGNGPIVASLHRKCEEIRTEELAKTFGRLAAIDPQLRTAFEACTEAIVSKILHDPILSVKEGGAEAASPDEGRLASDWLRRLFRL